MPTAEGDAGAELRSGAGKLRADHGGTAAVHHRQGVLEDPGQLGVITPG
jgi:hypothetical protein